MDNTIIDTSFILKLFESHLNILRINNKKYKFLFKLMTFCNHKNHEINILVLVNYTHFDKMNRYYFCD